MNIKAKNNIELKYEFKDQKIIFLAPELIEMLHVAKEDIKAGRLISEEELKVNEPDWLK